VHGDRDATRGVCEGTDIGVGTLRSVRSSSAGQRIDLVEVRRRSIAAFR